MYTKIQHNVLTVLATGVVGMFLCAPALGASYDGFYVVNKSSMPVKFNLESLKCMYKLGAAGSANTWVTVEPNTSRQLLVETDESGPCKAVDKASEFRIRVVNMLGEWAATLSKWTLQNWRVNVTVDRFMTVETIENNRHHAHRGIEIVVKH